VTPRKPLELSTIQDNYTNTTFSTCNGSVAIGAFPASGAIPCASGYSTTFTWNSVNEGIQATYATPSAAAFTYNVPQTSNDGTTYIFGMKLPPGFLNEHLVNRISTGFADYFPSAQAAAAFVAKHFTA